MEGKRIEDIQGITEVIKLPNLQSGKAEGEVLWTAMVTFFLMLI